MLQCLMEDMLIEEGLLQQVGIHKQVQTKNEASILNKLQWKSKVNIVVVVCIALYSIAVFTAEMIVLCSEG